jgi:hypothetical protein
VGECYLHTVEVVGSNPTFPTIFFVTIYLYGDVAQLGERTVRIRKVESSILFISTIMKALNTLRFQGFRPFTIDVKGTKGLKLKAPFDPGPHLFKAILC